jgi:coproporphyrinogen III oxidase
LVCGGQDLTPYLFEEDAIHFHQTPKLLATTQSRFYQNIKQCDAYFGMHIEMKLVDSCGLFFDYCKETKNENGRLDFVTSRKQSTLRKKEKIFLYRSATNLVRNVVVVM